MADEGTQTISSALCFGGTQGVYSHESAVLKCTMQFAVFVPPQAEHGPCPGLFFLSGLTCSPANVMDKGEYRALAAELGMVIVCPDTSPRGEDVSDVTDDWQLGQGAGFYIDATEQPWAANFRMESYIVNELFDLVVKDFPIAAPRIGITGHSMGGHGALTLCLKYPTKFQSCSAFAPIVSPTTCDWSRKGFAAYLGADESDWAVNDAVKLIKSGKRFRQKVLVDQGTADGFLNEGLKPWLLKEACAEAELPLTLNMREGYDHSYYFISTFMNDHLRWHFELL